MEIKINFNIISNDGFNVAVEAFSTLTGSYIPADFNHDIEDDRECTIDKITFRNDDGDEFEPSLKIINLVNEHVDDNVIRIYNYTSCKDDYNIYISDFKSDHDYKTLTL